MGGKRSKRQRESVKVTDTWFRDFCKPRLTPRDIKIIRFVNRNRLVTSKQVEKVFWRGRSQSKYLCNRRLRVLYDLHCVDRFFPRVGIGEGSAPQHLCLDYAGAKALKLDSFNKMQKLPISYKHYILVAEFRLNARLKGFGWGRREEKIGSTVADIYYPNYKICIEVDRGTETLSTLDRKAQKYNQIVTEIDKVVFITNGTDKRKKRFKQGLKYPGGSVITAKFDDLKGTIDLLWDIRTR